MSLRTQSDSRYFHMVSLLANNTLRS